VLNTSVGSITASKTSELVFGSADTFIKGETSELQMFCVQTGHVVSVSGLQWVSFASGFSQQSGTSCFASVIWQNAIGATDTIPVKRNVDARKICKNLRIIFTIHYAFLNEFVPFYSLINRPVLRLPSLSRIVTKYIPLGNWLTTISFFPSIKGQEHL
jgi:hypothetical protein